MKSKLAAFAALVGVSLLGYVMPAVAMTYGAGSYGSCQYESCGITLSSSASVALDVTPVSGATRCTVASDTVSVTTSSSTGYTVTLSATDTTNQLVSGNNDTIAAMSAPASSPSALTANTWGYRVDGQGSFGAGPTQAVASGAIPMQTFAFVPPANGTADTVMTSQSSATTTDTGYVWYGICVDSSAISGSYADSVTYTAVTN